MLLLLVIDIWQTAKILTFAYALIMMAVVVGTAEQVVENLAGMNDSPFISGNVTVNPTISPDGKI